MSHCVYKQSSSMALWSASLVFDHRPLLCVGLTPTGDNAGGTCPNMTLIVEESVEPQIELF